VKETICHSNWKIGIDNYLECDHCTIVHKQLVSVLDLGQYEMEMEERYSYQGTPLKGMEADFDLGKGGRYYWLYPNTWFSFDPGPANLSIHQSIPMDHQTTKYIYTTFFMNETVTTEEEELMAMDTLVRQDDVYPDAYAIQRRLFAFNDYLTDTRWFVPNLGIVRLENWHYLFGWISKENWYLKEYSIR